MLTEALPDLKTYKFVRLIPSRFGRWERGRGEGRGECPGAASQALGPQISAGGEARRGAARGRQHLSDSLIKNLQKAFLITLFVCAVLLCSMNKKEIPLHLPCLEWQ